MAIKYATRTVRIVPKDDDTTTLDDMLDKEIEYIYKTNGEENIVSMTITPYLKESIESYKGKHYQIDYPYKYYIVYVYKYEVLDV